MMIKIFMYVYEWLVYNKIHLCEYKTRVRSDTNSKEITSLAATIYAVDFPVQTKRHYN